MTSNPAIHTADDKPLMLTIPLPLVILSADTDHRTLRMIICLTLVIIYWQRPLTLVIVLWHWSQWFVTGQSFDIGPSSVTLAPVVCHWPVLWHWPQSCDIGHCHSILAPVQWHWPLLFDIGPSPVMLATVIWYWPQSPWSLSLDTGHCH